MSNLRPEAGTALAIKRAPMRKPMPAFLQHPLAREIALAIAVKLVLIAAIFYAFFDGRLVRTDAAAVAEQLANPQHAAHPPSTSGNSHAD